MTDWLRPTGVLTIAFITIATLTYYNVSDRTEFINQADERFTANETKVDRIDREVEDIERRVTTLEGTVDALVTHVFRTQPDS